MSVDQRLESKNSISDINHRLTNLVEICAEDLDFLDANDLAVLDYETRSVKPTGILSWEFDSAPSYYHAEYGKIMAKYYVKASTVTRVIKMKAHATIREVVNIYVSGYIRMLFFYLTMMLPVGGPLQSRGISC